MQNIILLLGTLILSVFQNRKGEGSKSDSKRNPFWRYLIIGIAVFYLLKNEINDYRKEAEKDKVFTDENARIAFNIWGALNIKQAFGFDLPFDLIPADEESLFNYASQIRNIEAVKKSYTLQFERDLFTDLRNELGVETFQRWAAQIGKPSNVIARINLTSFDPVTGKPLKDYKAGETVGKYMGETTVNTTQGAKTTVIITEVSEYFGLSKKQVYVLKSAVLL